MQHKTVLRFAEHVHAPPPWTLRRRCRRHREHIDVQRDAPHQGAAETGDIPIHRVQLDDLLHVEAADGEGHLGGVVEDGGEVEQRRGEDAPDVHDVPEKDRCCREKKPHAQAEEEQGHQRV